jgi:hypothetical protein
MHCDYVSSGSVMAVPQRMNKYGVAVTRLLAQTFAGAVWTASKHKVKKQVNANVTVRR